MQLNAVLFGHGLADVCHQIVERRVLVEPPDVDFDDDEHEVAANAAPDGNSADAAGADGVVNALGRPLDILRKVLGASYR